MSSTHLSLHYHLVFGTKHRAPFIDSTWRSRLHEYLGGSISGLGAFPQGIAGVADHVHLLVGLKATVLRPLPLLISPPFPPQLILRVGLPPQSLIR